MSRVLWDNTNGWHDGPECLVTIDSAGRLIIVPVDDSPCLCGDYDHRNMECLDMDEPRRLRVKLGPPSEKGR